MPLHSLDDSPPAVHPGVPGAQPHTFGTPPPPHVSLPEQDPQLIVPLPHPFGTVPQFWPSEHEVLGVHPQTLGMPAPRPPQLIGLAQPPQSRLAPQKSEMTPQVAFCNPQVVGWQTH